MTSAYEFLKQQFLKESEVWLEEILLKIYGINIKGPEQESFLKEDDLFLDRKEFSLKLFFKDTVIASFCIDVRGVFVIGMAMEKFGCNNFLKNKKISDLASWKVWHYCELPFANIYHGG